MKSRKIISILFIAIVTILMVTAVMATAQPVSAASKVKVTWNANGGKIGNVKTKVTTVNKGAKIKKLPTTPKRTEYVFYGWFTKKSGGIKITTATKVKKSLTYYAHWKKNINSPLVGKWSSNAIYPQYDAHSGNYVGGSSFSDGFQFNRDGTYKYFIMEGGSSAYYVVWTSGNYRVKGNKFYCTNNYENYTVSNNPSKSYTNKPSRDCMYTYEFTPEGNVKIQYYYDNGNPFGSPDTYYRSK